MTSGLREAPLRLVLLPVVGLVGFSYGLSWHSPTELKAIARWCCSARRSPSHELRGLPTRSPRAASSRCTKADRAGPRRWLPHRDDIASFHFYVAAIGCRLGCDDVIGTRSLLRANGDCRALIDGGNFYGANTLAMIEAQMAEHGIARGDAVVRFYSDHVSDGPTLHGRTWSTTRLGSVL